MVAKNGNWTTEFYLFFKKSMSFIESYDASITLLIYLLSMALGVFYFFKRFSFDKKSKKEKYTQYRLNALYKELEEFGNAISKRLENESVDKKLGNKITIKITSLQNLMEICSNQKDISEKAVDKMIDLCSLVSNVFLINNKIIEDHDYNEYARIYSETKSEIQTSLFNIEK